MPMSEERLHEIQSILNDVTLELVREVVKLQEENRRLKEAIEKANTAIDKMLTNQPIQITGRVAPLIHIPRPPQEQVHIKLPAIG